MRLIRSCSTAGRWGARRPCARLRGRVWLPSSRRPHTRISQSLSKGEIPDFVRFGRFIRPAILLAGRLFPDFDPWDVVPKSDAAKLSDEGVPLFIIHSTDDDIVPYEQAKILAAAYPDANVWKLEGYAHVEAYLHPEYAQRLREFLNASR